MWKAGTAKEKKLINLYLKSNTFPLWKTFQRHFERHLENEATVWEEIFVRHVSDNKT